MEQITQFLFTWFHDFLWRTHETWIRSKYVLTVKEAAYTYLSRNLILIAVKKTLETKQLL